MSFGKAKLFLFENQGVRQTVIRNGIWRSLALGFGKIIRLFVLLIAARWLGPNEFGTYNYALSVASLIFIFSDWGINLLFTRDAQHHDPQKVFSVAFTAKFLISSLSLIAACFALFFVPSVSSSLLLLVATTLFVTNMRELYVSAMIAKQRGELEGYSSSLEGLANIALLFGFLYGIRNATGFAIFNLATALSGLFVSLFFVRKYLRLTVQKIEPIAVATLLRAGLPLALFGITGYLFFAADQLFIEYFLGTESVGYYALATRGIYALMILPGIAVSVLFPVISLFSTNLSKLREVFYRGVLWLSLGGLLIASVLVIFREHLLFFVPQYSQSLPIISALAWILVFMFPSVLLDNTLIALNKQKQDFFLTLGAAFLNVVLNVIWIPRYGVIGAAYASVLSQAVNTAITFLYAHLLLKKGNP